MLDDFIIHFFIQLAIIQENSIHLFQFLDNEVTLCDHGFDCDTPTYKHLINSNKLGKFFIIDHLFESLDFIFKTNH